MAQKILEPFRKLPQQIHNFGIIQKIHDFATGKTDISFGNCLSSAYGCLDSPTALAFDIALGLLAVGTKSGVIKVYGTPGVAFIVRSSGSAVVALEFCPKEGRIASVHADGFIELHELNVKTGVWVRRSRVCVVNQGSETPTCMAVGDKVVYVGSSVGTLRQLAREGGRLCLGDESLTACTASMVVETVPLDKRQDVHVDSPIVSLAMQPEGNHLLVAYASGCVAVAIPQPPLNATAAEPRSADTAPTAEVEPTTPNTEENPIDTSVPSPPTEVVNEPQVEVVSEPQAEEAAEPSQSPVTGAPVTGSGERRATLRLKGLTRSLRGTESAKPEAETEPKLTVPPAPRISHLLIRDQAVESAAWRVTSVGSLSTEVVIAYGDGAFQIWPIVAAVSQQPQEPIIVSKREPPSTPYGPLPCGAIKKILINPGEHGGMLTAFSGGLPRPEFQDRHAVTVMQGQEHHVCFQFGSEIKDFVFIPKKGALAEMFTTESDCNPSRSFAVSALLVLTERELLAIDLIRSDWPVLQLPHLSCMNLSPVTAVTLLSQVPSSRLQSFHRDPDVIWGGYNDSKVEILSDQSHYDVAILGEANGLISMFAMDKGDCVYRVGTLHTASLFAVDGDSGAQKCLEEETWPPFRRVGYCALMNGQCAAPSDHRLAVSRIDAFVDEANRINLIVGGTGGHVSLWRTELNCPNQGPVAFEPDVARIHASLVDPDSSTVKYQWNGPSALRPFEGVTQLYDSNGIVFVPHALIQLDPPTPIISIACERSWNLLAIGSLHGFAVIDLLAKSTIYTQLLYDKPLQQKITHAVSSVQRELVSRGKQITASMRQSFRRLKQFRSASIGGSKSTEAADANQPKKTVESTDQTQEAGDEAPVTEMKTDKVQTENIETEKPIGEEAIAQPPVEQAKEKVEDENADIPIEIETITLPTEDNPASVRSLLFADTFLLSPPSTDESQMKTTKRTPSLWVGTSNGRAIAHVLKWEGTQGPVQVQLLKELQLRHQAPIINMFVIDAGSRTPVLSSLRKRDSCEPLPKTADKNPEESPEEVSGEVSATSPADIKSTSVETGTTTEAHQLLVCSEEQVKLFTLPALRALHKHKYVDRIRLPYGVGQITLTSDSPNPKSEKQAPDTTEQGETVGELQEESKGQTNPQYHRKSLTAVGMQCFFRDGPDPSKGEWFVIAVRHDCKGSVLTVPHLRQICKLRKHVDDSVHPVHCVSSLSNANFILWHVGRQLFVQELSSAPRLLSPYCCAPGHPYPSLTITLPEWSRPGDSTQAEVVQETQNIAMTAPTTVESSEQPVTEVVEPLIEAQSRVPEKPISCEDDKDQEMKTSHDVIPSVPQAGDLTIDSIKEYLNGDDTITVKTFESSTEKHTLVEGGRIITTLHETEKIDGKIIKDDVVKFTSDGENLTPMITDSN